MQRLKRTKIANCALLCPLFIVCWRIRLHTRFRFFSILTDNEITRKSVHWRDLDFSLKRPLRGSNRFENTGLTGLSVIQKRRPRNLETALARRCPALSRCYSDHRRESRKRCVGDRKFSEMLVAMFFIARWMKISDAGRVNKFVDRITVTSLLLFLPGITDCRKVIGQCES
jgi:hypothetical protein